MKRVASVVLLLTAVLQLVHSQYRLPSPFGWRCSAGSCVREETTFQTRGELLPHSTCLLTCATYGTLWPRPTKYAKLAKKSSLFLAGGLVLSRVRAPNDAVDALTRDAWNVFVANVKTMATPTGDAVSSHGKQVSQHTVSVDVTVSHGDLHLSSHSSELYTLGITTTMPQKHLNESQTSEGGKTRVTIIGGSFFGARHGLETLSQLIAYNEEEMAYEIISTAAIVDEPAYPYRGLLLDTARSYFTVDSIKRTLDGMAANKLNTLHWHISDSQSFPLQLRTLPKMSHYGAFSPSQVYTPANVKDIVKYARVRGVRVIPELDAPGHVGNGWQWGPQEGLGELLSCFNKRPWTQYCVEPPCGQLNLANPNIYTVLSKIYQEMLDLFGPLELFHFGGDEVNIPCWQSNPEMVAMVGSDNTQQAYLAQWATFQNTAMRLLTNSNTGTANITGMLWTSELTQKPHVSRYLDKSQYIIQVWSKKGDLVIKDLLEQGYRLIFSNSDAWYLDCGFSSWVSDGLNWCSPYKSWQEVYDNSPSGIAYSATGTHIHRNQILGGEVAAWAEQMDSVSVDGKVWPRAAAFAERVWSDPTSGWKGAETRLVHQRNRLVKRGVRADSIKPEWCRYNDGLCTTEG